VARRAVRTQDLFDEARFSERVREALDLHNFVLTGYLGAQRVDPQEVIDGALALAPRIKPMIADVSYQLNQAMRQGHRLLFEGRRARCSTSIMGPIRSSPRATPCRRSRGRRSVAPQQLHYVLGITKAYATRVGSGPFPTELTDVAGEDCAGAATSSAR